MWRCIACRFAYDALRPVQHRVASSLLTCLRLVLVLCRLQAAEEAGPASAATSLPLTVREQSNPAWQTGSAGGVFSGLYFTLAALRGSEVERPLALLIR